VKVTPVATYNLSEDFSAGNVMLTETGTSGVYTAAPADAGRSACFMRLKFEKAR